MVKLGRHRILRGDARLDIMRLLEGQHVNLLLTDPPYGINILRKCGSILDPSAKAYTAQNHYEPIFDDDKPFNPQHLLSYGDIQILFGANNYASKLPDKASWLAWDKGTPTGMKISDVELAWINKKDAVRCPLYRYLWNGMRRQGSIRQETARRIHPTQKPVGLFAEIIQDFSRPNDIILDPYLGSGTTLIACEKTGRICYGMEIEPSYIDKTIKRYYDYVRYDEEQTFLDPQTVLTDR